MSCLHETGSLWKAVILTSKHGNKDKLLQMHPQRQLLRVVIASKQSSIQLR